MKTKQCTKCKKIFPKEYFWFRREKHLKHILNSHCKKCCGKNTKNYYMMQHYGITFKDFLLLHNKQKAKCAICKMKETSRDPISKKIKFLYVDHDHKTGKIRQLLCNKCNRGIGYFNDEIIRVFKLLIYLIKHKILAKSLKVR